MAEYIERGAAYEAIMSEPPDAHYPQWYADKIKAIPAADVEPVQEWISVKDERKPKEGEDVLVAIFDGYDTYTDIDCLMRDGKWCFETENYKVTHWMEKPQPPKGE